VISIDPIGIVKGESGGQAVISALNGGRKATALMSVTAEDALRLTGAVHQGDLTRGTTMMMGLVGYYSVDSADAGRLSLRITDQAGLIATTSPRTVAKGGDFFVLTSTFVVPANSTQICRTAILEVGPVTVAEPTSDASGLRCLAIRP
jgi:hypothetical protein